MTEITICIPAYRSEKSIAKTLQSVQCQSFGNFIVEIGLESTDDSYKTYNVCEKYLADSRFNLSVNPKVLGWAQNISNLLRKVDTPYFIILPHDDILHPDYLGILYEAIKEQPHVSVAYADMFFIGKNRGEKFLAVDNDNFFSRLLSFFLAGAEAVPWRGVTRKKVLSEGVTFSHNEYSSFAVECEWALHLIQQGEAYRVPLPLYYKRAYSYGSKSVSSEWRLSFSEQKIKAALEHHRNRMLAGISTAHLTHEEIVLIKLACESAMLRRFLNFSQNRFTLQDCHLSRIDEMKEVIGSLKPEIGIKILSRIELALSRNELIRRQNEAAETYARDSVGHDNNNWEAFFHLAQILLRKGEVNEALILSSKASKIAPYTLEINGLVEKCQNDINQLYSIEIEQHDDE